jgi:hypothetical protein
MGDRTQAALTWSITYLIQVRVPQLSQVMAQITVGHCIFSPSLHRSLSCSKKVVANYNFSHALSGLFEPTLHHSEA